jgi:catechol-2,3-dioxygenase
MKLRTVNKALAVLIVVGLIVMAVQSIPEKTTVGRVLQQVIEQGREGNGPSDSWTASTHYSPDENLEGIEIGAATRRKTCVARSVRREPTAGQRPAHGPTRAAACRWQAGS